MEKNNKSADVLFFIEHTDRELFSACAIAFELKKEYGVSVKIASMIFHPFIVMLKEQPKIIVLPYVKSEMNEVVKIFRALYGESISFVNLNYEQIMNPYLQQFKKPRDIFAQEKLIQFCWGESFKQYYLDLNVKESNIYITGKPENTILKIMKRNQIKDFKARICNSHDKLELSKKWLFFPMADTYIFSPNNFKKNINSGKWEKEKLIEYRNYLFHSVNTIIDWLCRIENTKYSQNNIFIIRPHPSVSVDEYKNLFDEKLGYMPDYVYVTRDMSVKEWLLVCDKCYSNYSTVLLDALFIQTPSYLIRADQMPQFAEMDWFNDISNIVNFHEFTATIESSEETVLNNLIDRYIDTERNAVVETANILHNLASVKEFPRTTIWNILKCAFQCFPIYTKSLIRFCFINLRLNAFVRNVRYDYFNKKEVAAILEQFPLDSE